MLCGAALMAVHVFCTGPDSGPNIAEYIQKIHTIECTRDTAADGFPNTPVTMHAQTLARVHDCKSYTYPVKVASY